MAETTRCRQGVEQSSSSWETFRPVLFGLSRAKWRLQCINTLPPPPEHSPFSAELCWHQTAPRRGRQPARLRNTPGTIRPRRIKPFDRREETSSGSPNIPPRLRENVRSHANAGDLTARAEDYRWRWLGTERRALPSRDPVPASADHALKHDPEKWIPVFPRDKRGAFARRSCSKKRIVRDDDSKKCHLALVALYRPMPGVSVARQIDIPNP